MNSDDVRSPTPLWRRWWPVGGGEVRRWTGVMTLLVGVLAYLVIDKSDDWHGLVEAAIDKGRKPKLEEIGWGWLWVATVINLGIAGVLWLALPVWAQPSSMKVKEKAAGGRRWWMWVLVMVVVALAVRVPRMGLSLYNDEAHNYARLFAGSWEMPDIEGEPEFDVARWGETFWRNSGGNNAQPYSILARLCLDAAIGFGWVQQGEVSEWGVRLPSLISGLASIALAGWLALRLLGWRGMMATMVVLAVHPWHVRHSTEARGQSLLFLGAMICFCCLALALEKGRWRAWFGYGFGLFLCASSFIGSVYFLFAMNVCLITRQLWEWKHGRLAIEQVWRPVISGTFGVMAGVLLMLPILPELLTILANNPAFRGEMGSGWWLDVFGFGYAGTRWRDMDVDNPNSMALIRWVPSLSKFWVYCLGLWILSILFGLYRLIRFGGVARLVALSMILGVPLTWGVASLQGNFLNLWYLYFAVPTLALALGASVAAVWQKGGRIPQVIAGSLLLLVIAVPLLRVSLELRDTPKQQVRWPVEVARGAAYPHSLKAPRGREVLTAGFWCNSDLYDPLMKVLKERSDLDNLIAQARSENKELWVCFSHAPLARKNAPELVGALEDGSHFEHVGTAYGLEEVQFATHLYRLLPE